MPFKSTAQRKWFFANQGNSGSAGTSKSNPQIYKEGTDPVKTITKQNKPAMDKAVKEGNKEIAKNKEDVEKIKKYSNLKEDSRDKFFNKENGQYTPERKRIHTKLINKVDNKKAFPNKGEKPEVIFIGGLTASGKTSAISKIIDRKPNQPDYKAYPKHIYLNADDFKGWLPEYNGYNAGYLHEESSDLFDNALIKFQKQKKQIIIDATLKNTQSANKKIQSFKKSGYEVRFLGTNLAGEKSIERATGRFKKSKRYVPLELIEKNAEPTNKSVMKLRHKADKYAVFNTDVKKGQAPKLVESDDSLRRDRKKDAKIIYKTEKEWRKTGVDKSDLKGYDTKKHKKVKVKI
tara:strand:+ start:1106 stop:2146 length:1041 start_codon:yes stop_codon:yes gene_type:complete